MLNHKSTKNLSAGEALSALGLTDAAANRYYYALYQAAVHRLTVLGWTPGRFESGAVQWSHTMIYLNIFLVRRRRSDRALFDAMRNMRERADYSDRSVEAGSLAAHVAAVREFVEEGTEWGIRESRN